MALSGQLSLMNIQDYDRTVKGVCTIFKLSIKPGLKAYRYDVKIVKIRPPKQNPSGKKPQGNKGKEVELTKQNDAGLRSARRQCCSDIITALFLRENGFKMNCKHVYDGKATLYTNKSIDFGSKSYRLVPTDFLPRTNEFLGSDYWVEVTISKNVQNVDYSDLGSALVEDAAQRPDHSVRSFLELLTSQPLINTSRYQYITFGCLFENESRVLSNDVPGVDVRVGIKKGIRVAGSREDPAALMVVDMKRSAFFACKNLLDIYSAFVTSPANKEQRKAFERFMRDVRLVVTYDPSKTILFSKLSLKNIGDEKYKIKEKRQTVPEYFKEVKNRTIKANIPGVHPNQPRGDTIIYPMDCLKILDGQLVPPEKLTVKAGEILLTQNSVDASQRYTYVQQQVETMANKDGTDFLGHFGVSIEMQSNSVDIHQRSQPKIRVGEGVVVTPKSDGTWGDDITTTSHRKFVDPTAKLLRWIVIYEPPENFEGTSSKRSSQSQVNETTVKSQIKALRFDAKTFGIKLPEPERYVQVNGQNMEQVFRDAERAKIQFIFYINTDKHKNHKRLKLYEANFKILTQHVCFDNLANKQRRIGIIMKLNIKARGCNFVPVVDPDLKDWSLESQHDVLIIGYDVCHPKKTTQKEWCNFVDKLKIELKLPKDAKVEDIPKDELFKNTNPSVVGICANKMTTDLWGFAGDFFYQKGPQESVEPEYLKRAVKNIVSDFIKKEVAGKQATPKRVIVLRDGISEGQLEMAINQELPEIRNGIIEMCPGLNPKITLIVATKRHNKRIYRWKGNNSVESSQMGDIVDSKIVRPDIIEFYQQSHTPIKGVAKMLQLAVLVNENEIPINIIQKLIILLSNLHQVSTCPTSLPLPIYLADETAKRGMDIYNELYEHHVAAQRRGTDPPSRPGIGFGNKFSVRQCGIFNFDVLTEVLGYSGTRLSKSRYNA